MHSEARDVASWSMLVWSEAWPGCRGACRRCPDVVGRGRDRRQKSKVGWEKHAAVASLPPLPAMRTMTSVLVAAEVEAKTKESALQ